MKARPSIVLSMVLALWGPAAPAGENTMDERVDVGGYRLHISCVGQGGPTVILEHGLGGSSRDFRKVQQGLSPTTRTCLYDRAGYGDSDAGPAPRTSARLAAELRTLLQRAEIPPPYVLVGHSFGGYTARMFAALFPAETAGLVLVDTPNEGQIDAFFQNRIMREIDPLGLLKEFWTPDLLDTLEELDPAPLAPLLGYSAKTLRTMLAELAGFRESGAELEATPGDMEIPAVIIMHGLRILPDGELGDEMEQEWMRLQQALAERYRNGTFMVAPGSSHNIPLHEPDLLIRAVENLVQRLRGAPFDS